MRSLLLTLIGAGLLAGGSYRVGLDRGLSNSHIEVHMDAPIPVASTSTGTTSATTILTPYQVSQPAFVSSVEFLAPHSDHGSYEYSLGVRRGSEAHDSELSIDGEMVSWKRGYEAWYAPRWTGAQVGECELEIVSFSIIGMSDQDALKRDCDPDGVKP